MSDLINIKNYIFSNCSEISGPLAKILNEAKGKNGVEVSEVEEHFLNVILNKEIPFPKFVSIDQKDIIMKIADSTNKWVNISAPTSFGKSKIITDLVFDKKFLIISPTLSLCNEYFMEFTKKNIKTSMTFIGDEFKYILTPEKAVILFEANPTIKFDYIIFDEFYETFSSRGRFDKFKSCLRKSYVSATRLITISPKTVEFDYSEIFLHMPDNISKNRSATTRRINTIYFKKNITEHYLTSELFKRETIDGLNIKTYEKSSPQEFVEQLINFNDLSISPSILVLTRKSKMYKMLSDFSSKSTLINEGFFSKKLCEYLSVTSPNTVLERGIRKGIAYHNGSMDKYVRFLIELAFKNGELKVLIANSTLTKGVNINPQVLIVDGLKKMAKQSNESFQIELRNSLGRTGRLKNSQYIGDVYFLVPNTNEAKEKIANTFSDEIIRIKAPEVSKPKIVSDITSAYKDLVADKNKYKSKPLSQEQVDTIKKIVESRRDEKFPEKLSNTVTSYFDIKWKGGSESYWIFVIYQNFFSLGYKKIYEHNLKNIIGKENIWQNDEALASAIFDYQNVVEFEFHQLVSFMLKKASEDGQIEKTKYLEYLESFESTNAIATTKGWPDCFAHRYIFSNENKAVADELNLIMEMAKKLT